jgi:hypothetical protein
MRGDHAMSFICYIHRLDAGMPYMEVLGTTDLAEAELRAAELLRDHPGSIEAEIFEDDISLATVSFLTHG